MLIVYKREFWMRMRLSDPARPPPANLPVITSVPLPTLTSANTNVSYSSPINLNDEITNISPLKSLPDCPTMFQTVTGKLLPYYRIADLCLHFVAFDSGLSLSIIL